MMDTVVYQPPCKIWKQSDKNLSDPPPPPIKTQYPLLQSYGGYIDSHEVHIKHQL